MRASTEVEKDPMFDNLPLWKVVGIWVGVFILLGVIRFGIEQQYLAEDKALKSSVYIILLQGCIAIFFWHVLLPRLWRSQKRIFFILISVLVVVVLAPLRYYIIVNYSSIPAYSRDPSLGTYFFTIAVVGNLASVLFMLGLWVVLEARLEKRKRLEAEVHRLKADIQLLKTQIQPHFLLNTLNNLYAVAQYEPDRMPDLLLKLSDILRYVLYDCQYDWVSLSKEQTYLTNYVELYQLKSERKLNVKLVWSIYYNDVTLPPMLLQPLIENGLKHSYVLVDTNASVSIVIKAWRDKFEFFMENTLTTQTVHTVPQEKGIGLENVKRRLVLIYGNRASLNTEVVQNRFITKLILPVE